MKSLAIGICAALCMTAAHAEQMYVSDKLVVGVFASADSETTKLASLETGDAVEVLEREDKYLKVRLSDGREGWVRSSYLVKQAPAIVKLKELQAAGAAPATTATPSQPNAQLAQEIAKLKEQNATLLNERDALKNAAASASTPQSNIDTPEPTTQSANQDPSTGNSISMRMAMWSVASLIASGLLGFYFGYRTLAARIRRKYGSVKIY